MLSYFLCFLPASWYVLQILIFLMQIFTVSRAPASLPFLLEDASRSQTEIDLSQETGRPFASVLQVRETAAKKMKLLYDWKKFFRKKTGKVEMKRKEEVERRKKITKRKKHSFSSRFIYLIDSR